MAVKSITRTNHDIYRAFVLGKYIEEGYVHLPPSPMAASPFDSTYRCLSALLLLPSLLLPLAIGLAHSGWWNVSTGAGVVAVGHTVNFRAAARFAAMLNCLPMLARGNLRLIHCELAMSGMSGMSAADRLVRFASAASSSWDVRLGGFLLSCGMAYTALLPPSFNDSLSSSVGLICGFMALGVFMFALGVKYLYSPIGAAAPHVRDKTSLRTQCARQVRDVVCTYLVLLAVFLRFAAYFSFVAEIIPITEEQGCDSDSRSASSGCRGFEGRSQCELNLGFLPFAAFILVMGIHPKVLAHGSSMADVMSKMQGGGLPIGAIVVAAVVLLIGLMNFIALSIGLDDVALCSGIGYISWAPCIIVVLPTSIVMSLQGVMQTLEQHFSSRTLRRMMPGYHTIIADMARDAGGMAVTLGVRESRWDTQGEFSAFLVSLSMALQVLNCIVVAISYPQTDLPDTSLRVTEPLQGGSCWGCATLEGSAVGAARSAGFSRLRRPDRSARTAADCRAQRRTHSSADDKRAHAGLVLA
jgi:hypothetical protein